METALFCSFQPGKVRAFVASRLIRKPINTIANLFAFSPAPLNNIKHIFVTQVHELAFLLLHDSCLVVEDSSEQERERKAPRKANEKSFDMI